MTSLQQSKDFWRKTLISIDATLMQAINNLDESSAQIVLVISNQDTLVGTLTDGDIRRGLLRGIGLNSSINSIVNRDPLVAPPQMASQMASYLMRVNTLNAIPIVDEARRVVGLHLLGGALMSIQRPNLMVIMAGGQGKRLHPYTDHCPKPMLPVGGKPLLEEIIERAKAEGFQNFAISVNYLGHMIEDYFGDGSHWQVRIDYLREDSPLGTAGAIALLNPRPQLPFLVSNGDVLSHIRYGEFLDYHCRMESMATMAVRLYEWRHPFGVVHINGVDIVSFEEKPTTRNYINAGVYALEPAAINALSAGEECDMPTLFSRLQESAMRTVVYPMHEPWLDVGCASDYEQAVRLYKAPD